MATSAYEQNQSPNLLVSVRDINQLKMYLHTAKINLDKLHLIESFQNQQTFKFLNENLTHVRLIIAQMETTV